MVENKVEAIKSLFSFELKNEDSAFLFLGYSGILLRSEDLTIAIDPGKSLTRSLSNRLMSEDRRTIAVRSPRADLAVCPTTFENARYLKYLRNNRSFT